MDHDAVEKIAQATAEKTVTEMRGEIVQAVDEGVTEALTRVGIDAEDPMEMQRDMQFVRDWRTTVGSVRRKGLLTAVGFLVAGTVGALWLGIKSLLT